MQEGDAFLDEIITCNKHGFIILSWNLKTKHRVEAYEFSFCDAEGLVFSDFFRRLVEINSTY